MGILEAIFLGVVQGLTEFLPVSSTGHLILARELFTTENTPALALAFDAILHLATATAVVVYFYKDIIMLVNTALRKLSRLPVNKSDATLLYALAIATVPAVVLGFLLESLMEDTFRDPRLVAGVLVAGSFLFIYAEWVYMHQKRNNELNLKKGLQIGFFQALALIPGMSRSGATISGGMLLGLSRSEAARFAFLMAVPVITGAGLKKLLELMMSDGTIAWGAVAAGAVTAFLTGLLAVHFMLSFVRKHTLWPFIWYRIILACLVMLLYWFG